MALGIKCIRSGCQYSGEECTLWNECPLFRADTGLVKKQRAKKDIPRPTEDEVQEAVVEFCDCLHIACVHIPNESKRSAAYGAKMKRMGLRKGFPDLFIPMARQGFHGLFIELKVDKSSRVQPEQKTWIVYLNEHGYKATICCGADEAIEEIKKYMEIR